MTCGTHNAGDGGSGGSGFATGGATGSGGTTSSTAVPDAGSSNDARPPVRTPPPASLELWKKIDQCTGSATTTRQTCEGYTRCSAGVESTLCSLPDGSSANVPLRG